MLKYTSALAFGPESGSSDPGPVKNGLQSLRFHLCAYLCDTGLVEKAYPQKRVADLIGAEPVICVDPAQIVHAIPRTKPFEPLRRRCFFVNGDWDRGLPEYSFHRTYRILRDLLKEPARDGLADTLAFRRVQTLVGTDRPVSSRGNPVRTDDQIIEYLNRCLDLRDSLLRHGYQNTEDREDRDIGLAVGSDGQLHHFSHGKHRLALAQLLRLKTVRAKVRIMHPHWYFKQVEEAAVSRRDILRTNADEILPRILDDLSSTEGLEDLPGDSIGDLEDRPGDAA